MSKPIKDQAAILKKLGISSLNDMQMATKKAIQKEKDLVLLSPTGSGKTLAFLIPLVDRLSLDIKETQALILVPSRELAIQILTVLREMGTGYKANAVYGGRAGFKDRMELKHPPAILIGTPGRVADHLRNEEIETHHIKTLILDEFDKSLEVGFEKEMKEIILSLDEVNQKILTSATQKIQVPEFVGLKDAERLDFLDTESTKLKLRMVYSADKDKLNTLLELLQHIGNGNGIIFCNFKDSIQYASNYLTEHNVDHNCFYGGMDQVDRERALIKFRNGTHQIMIATDLAARGLDIPELNFIIHYQVPPKVDEFTHRNGRTARMHANGTAYVLLWKEEKAYSFLEGIEEEILSKNQSLESSPWATLYISGGRKDKISKGDIAGLFFKQGNLNKPELGLIELKQDCAYVAVSKNKVKMLISKLNNSRLKKKKVRVSLLQ